MNTRRTEVEIWIAGKNVTADIKKYLKSVTFTDVMEGESDTAQINLHDSDRLFIGDWFPQRGDSCKITLIKTEGDLREVMNLNDFEIDEITNSINNSGNTASIKLNSIANKSELRSIDKSRSWENVKLSKIAQDIAADGGMTLFYDTDIDPEIKRAEQKEKSNLSFLYGLCKKHYLALKVSEGNQLVIFDAEKYEQQEPAAKLSYGDGKILTFSGSATISKIYKGCHVKYQHGKDAVKYDYTYTDDTKESGIVMEVNEKVESQAEAERLARCKLKDKNRDEIKININAMGDFAYNAGSVIELGNFGFYDGKYMLKKVQHTVDNGGYVCKLECYKC